MARVGESTVVGGIIFGDVNLVIVIHSLVVAVQRIGDNLGYIAFAHHEHFIHFAQRTGLCLAVPATCRRKRRL